jgi:hypothetical protein
MSEEPICDCKWWDEYCLLGFFPCDCEKCSYYEEEGCEGE